MRVSRWGWSSYETEEALAAEAHRLASHAQVVARRSDAEIITVNSGTRVDAALLEQAPSARFVLTTTSGFDHLDLAELARRGIVAGRCPIARRDAVVESSLALLLHGLRRHGPLAAASRQGQWARARLPSLGMRTLRGSRVGVVGLGVIGSRMVESLQCLGAHVHAYDPVVTTETVPQVDLPTLFSESDAITLHCRLEPGSRRLVDASLLSRASDLVLVNTARGDIVDVHAALDALHRGQLSALGLDVFPQEPWPTLAESLDARITYLPHAAGFHAQLNTRVAEELEQAVMAAVAGAPIPHRVG